jgi:hypothetical protein
MTLSLCSTRTSIALVVVVSHIYSIIVFGAVFWFDSIHYVNLGECLRSSHSLAVFYDGIGSWFFTHLQPGVPLAWLATSAVPDSFRWPLMALFQHALAGYALYLCFLTVDRYWPSPVHVFACVAISFLPFYQSLHGALLSESITSSLLLIAFSMSLCAIKQPSFQKRAYFGILLCLFLIAQFRSYYGLIIVAFTLTVLLKHGMLLSKYILICCLVTLTAFMSFPMYRYYITDRFLMPSAGMNALMAGWWVNPLPSAEVMSNFHDSMFPGDLSADKLVNKGLEYEQAIELSYFWRAEGLSDVEINTRAEKLGALLRNDDYRVFINRCFLALASTGAILPYCILDQSLTVFPGMSALMMFKHQFENYLFLSWIDASSHTKLFQAFFVNATRTDDFALQAMSKHLIASMTSHYISEHPNILRNPFLIGWVPPDIWVALGFFGLVVLAKREKYLVALSISAIGINFLVTFHFPLGNVRYAYSLFPLYFVVISIAIASVFSRQ